MRNGGKDSQAGKRAKLRARREKRGEARQGKLDRRRKMSQEEGLGDSKEERTDLEKAGWAKKLHPPTLAFWRPTPVSLLFSKCP